MLKRIFFLTLTTYSFSFFFFFSFFFCSYWQTTPCESRKELLSSLKAAELSTRLTKEAAEKAEEEAERARQELGQVKQLLQAVPPDVVVAADTGHGDATPPLSDVQATDTSPTASPSSSTGSTSSGSYTDRLPQSLIPPDSPTY